MHLRFHLGALGHDPKKKIEPFTGNGSGNVRTGSCPACAGRLAQPHGAEATRSAAQRRRRRSAGRCVACVESVSPSYCGEAGLWVMTICNARGSGS